MRVYHYKCTLIPGVFFLIELNWLFNVTINDISVIYVTAHRCAGGLKKKLNLRLGPQRHRHFVGFFNVGRVDSPKRTQKNPKDPKGPKRNSKGPKRRSRWFQTNIKHNYLASYITKSVHIKVKKTWKITQIMMKIMQKYEIEITNML